MFKNSGGEEETLEKALTLLDLLGGGRRWASREASLTEAEEEPAGDGAAPAPAAEPAEAEEACAAAAAPLLEVDLKAETAMETQSANPRRIHSVRAPDGIYDLPTTQERQKKKATVMGM